MKLISNEVMVSTTNGLILTNRRVRHSIKSKGCLHTTSLLLENIQSVSTKYTSKIGFLIVGLLVSIVATVGLLNEEESSLIGVIVGVLLIVFYYITREHQIIIASSSGKIVIQLVGDNKKNISDYIDLLEETICKRKSELATEVYSNR